MPRLTTVSLPAPCSRTTLANWWIPGERKAKGSDAWVRRPAPRGLGRPPEGSVHIPPCSELGSEGGRARPGRPAAPHTLPHPYLQRSAAGTGAGGPRTRAGSCRPFSRRPGGAGSRLLAHRPAGDATGSQWEAEPRARPLRPGLGGGFPRGRPAAETQTRAPGSRLSALGACTSLVLREPGVRVGEP